VLKKNFKKYGPIVIGLGLIVFLGAWGGGKPQTATPEKAAQAIRAQAAAIGLSNVSTGEAATQLLDFAERSFPAYFPGPQTNVTVPGFVYRYYPATGVYLGVALTSSAFVEGNVYVVGPPFGSTAQDLGAVTKYITPTSDPGTPTTLVTSANGQSTVSCAENQVCIDVLFAKGIKLATTLSQVASSWTDTSSNTITISKIPYVDGAVYAKDITAAGSVFSTSTDASYRYFKGNGLPSTAMGNFPVQSGTAAYSYYSALPGGTDPRTGSDYSSAAAISISPYDLTSKIPLNPTPTGFYPINSLIVGVTLTGTVWHIEVANDSSNNWYNPVNALPMDQCWGHPYSQQYHIHGYSWKCFPNQGTSGHSPLFGYALDGFGIYGPRGENGQMITNKQLDKCHGHTHAVMWNGTLTNIYHYHLNREYPYSVGCFRGKVNYFQALGSTDMRETSLPFYQDIPYPITVPLPVTPSGPT